MKTILPQMINLLTSCFLNTSTYVRFYFTFLSTLPSKNKVSEFADNDVKIVPQKDHRGLLKDAVISLLLIANLFFANISFGQTVTLDQVDLDYAPGETVYITGTGWHPGETVGLQVDNLTNPDVDCGAVTPQPHELWTVVADADGNFTASWYVNDCELGADLMLGALGNTSGFTYEVFFTDSVTTTAATGGINISADKAANATNPGYTTLGNIIIAENNNGDFSLINGTATIILTAPTGWEFNSGVGSITFTSSKDINSASLSVSASTITISLTAGVGNVTNKADAVTVSGIQVRPIEGGAAPSATVQIFRSSSNPGTLSVSGITQTANADGSGGTNFGSLSQTFGAINKLVVTLSGQTFTDGLTVATSGNSGSVTAQTAGTSFNITKLTATDQFFNIITTYSGSKTISYSGPSTGYGVPTYTTSVNFTNGQSTTVLATTLRKAETTTITASQGTTTGPASSSLVVNKANTTTIVVSNLNPSTYGQSVTFTATVSGVGTATGTVDFKDGSTTIGSGTLNGSGVATFSTSLLSAAAHTITAVFLGDGNFNTSTSSPITQTVNAKAITGNFTAANKIYNGNTAATVLIQTLNGVIAPDVVNLTGGTATFATKTVGTNKTVTLAGATLAGTDAGNYTLTSVATTTADITALDITGTFSSANKVYDGNTDAAATNRQVVGAVALDNVTLTGGTATFATKTVGTNKTVTLAGATLAGTDAGNYTLTSVATTTADITALDITGTFSSANKVYDGNTDAAATNRQVVGAVALDNVTLTGGTATFATKTVGTNKTVTLAGATLAGTDAGNYTLTSVATTTADITALDITGTFSSANKVYDGNTDAAATNRQVVGAVALDNVTLTGGTATFATKTVGTNKTVTLAGATLAGTDAGNYTLTSVATTTADITALDITGTFSSANKVYDGNTDAAATNRQVVGAVALDNVTLTGGTATFATKTVGTNKTVTLAGATLAGTDAGNYTLTSVATTTADITALDITGTFSSANKVYDGNTDAAATNRQIVGAVAMDNVTLTGGTATFATKTVGTNKTVTLAGATLAGTDAGNYTLTSVATTTADITALDITGTFSSANKVYDGNTDAAATNRQVVGAVALDNVTLTGGTATFATKTVGTNKTVTLAGATLAGTDAGNYTLTSVATTTADITALDITGTFSSANKVYDGNTDAAATNRQVVGAVALDNVTLTGGTATFATKTVGTNKTVTLAGATLAGTDAGNYTLTSVATTTADITALDITGTFSSANKVYDGNTDAAATNRQVVGAVALDNVTLTGGTATFATKTVGTNKTVTLAGATLAGTDAGNYTLTSVATTTADITALDITGTFSSANKVYDGNTDAAATNRQVVGAVALDNVTLTGGTATFATKTVGTNKTVTLAGATLAGTDAGNYTLTSVATTTADITALDITGTFSSANKVYDGNTDAAATNRQVVGAVAMDNVTLTGGTATFATKTVGTNKTVTLAGATLAGTDAGNYTLTSVATTTADITALDITGTFSSANKVYDGNTDAAATNRQVVGAVAMDNVTLTGGTATFATKTVGTNKTVTLAGATLAGTDAGNYTLTSVATTTADITALDITGTFSSANKVYDGNTDAAATNRQVVGAVALDNVTLTGGTATFATKTVGTNKTVTLAGATLAGTDAGNYTLTSVATTTADITALDITGTFSSANKVYDGNTDAAATNRQIVGAVAMDNVTLTGGTATFATKTVGTNKTVTLAGATLAGTDAGNYTLTSVATTTADITALDITGTFSSANKVYDGNTDAAATNRQVVGTVALDNVTLTGGTATFATKTVGTNKTVTLAGATLAGTDAGNYTLTSVATTTADITALDITGTFSSANKVYDGNTDAAATNRQVVGAVALDNVTLTGGTATFATKTVGTNKTVTLAGATLAGTDAGNYTLTSVATTTANITALGITGNFTADNKVYNGDADAAVLTQTLNDVIGTDDVSLTGGSASFSDKNVANGKTVTSSGMTLSGAQAGNYSLTSVGTTTANITALGITGNFTADNKVYDGDADAAVLTQTLNGVIGTDDVSLTGGSATFSDKNVANGKTVTSSGMTLSGAQAGNYSLTSVGTTTANITALGITGNFTADNKVYDGDADAVVLTQTLNGVIGTDDVSLTGGSATFSDKNVANGKTVTSSGMTLSGAQAGNYSLTSVGTTTANITALGITGNFTADNKVYDGDADAAVLTQTLNGVIGTDDVSLTGGSATFSDKNVANGKTVTSSGMTLSGAQAGNYSLTSVGTTTANITALGITGNFTADNKVYDGDADAAVLTQTLNGVIGTDDVSLTGGSATFSDKNVANGKTVTSSGMTLSGAQAGNYSLTSVGTTTANITALGITGNFTADNKVYDGDADAAVLTQTLNGVIGTDDVSLTGGSATFSDKNVANGKTVTSSGMTLSGAQAGNYSLTSVGTTTANITALGITGNFTADNKVYDGDADATVLTQTLNGVIGTDDVSLTGGSATFSDKNVANGKTVTSSGMTLSGAQAGNYSLTSVGTTTANITALGITGNFTADNKVYDGDADAAVLTQTLNGVIGTDDVSLTGGSATFSDKNVANGKTVTSSGMTLSGAQAGNYSLTSVGTTTANITALGITGNFTADNKVYDGDADAAVLTQTLNGVIGTDDVSLTGGSATFSDKNVANGKTVTSSGMTLSGAQAGNYSLTSVGTTTANITALGITGNFTADNKVYDGDADATVLTQTLNGVIGTDDVSLTGGSTTFSDKNVANGKTVTSSGMTLSGAQAGNYSLTSVGTTTANITALGITGNFTADNKVYDGDADAAVLTQTLNGVIGTDDVSLTGGSATFSDKNVANGKTVTSSGMTLSGAQAGNYSLTSVGTTTANITALGITGNFTADNKVYDGDADAAVLTQTLNGVIGTDDVSLTGGSATFSDKNVANGKTVTSSGMTLSGAQAGNYSLTSVGTTTANITALGITGNFTADNKVYDGDADAAVLTQTLNGVIGTDDVSLTGGSATFSDKNVANGKTVTSSGMTLSGAQAGNYSLTSVGTTTANITALGITGNFTADNKVYDGDADAAVLTQTLNGVIGTDDVSLTGGSATFSDKNVANGKTVTSSGMTLSGAQAGNYSLTSVGTTTANITALGITGNFTADNKVYDGDADAAVLTQTLNGVIGTDDVSLTGGSATFSDKNVANGKTVTSSGMTLSGAQAGNYSLTSVGTTTANITALGITGNFTADNKVYDGDADAAVLTQTLNGVIGTDDVSLTGGSATFSDKNVANGKTVTSSGMTLSGAQAGNYSLTSVGTTTANITALGITGNFTADNKVYDGDADAAVLTQTLNGVIGTDDVSLTGGSATFSDKNVANGKTVTSSGMTLSGAQAGNYSLTSVGTTTANITALGITGNFTADNKVYDGDADAAVLTQTLNGVIGTDDVSLTGGSATFSDKNVANGKTVTSSGMTLSGAQAGNYSLTSVGTTTANITALGITGNFTADNKVYDGDADAAVLTQTLNGVIGTDDVSLTGGSATFSDKNVANGKTVTSSGMTLSGAQAGNYSLTSVGTTTANITALGITGNFTADNKVYDGDADAAVLTQTLNGVIGTDDVSLTGGSATFSDKNVANGKTVTSSGMTLSGAQAGNYSLTSVGTTTANITALGITGNFTADNKVYDGDADAAVLTQTLNGVIGTDDVSLTGGSATFSDKNVANGKTVTSSGMTLSGAQAGNYSLTSVGTTTANITALGITGNFTADNKVYDGDADAAVLTQTLNGVIGTDDVSLTGGSATFSDKNVANGKTVTSSGMTLSGAQAGNYSLTSVGTTTANITALGITGNFTADNKVYDGDADAAVLTQTLNGVIGTDDVSLTGGSATFSDKNVANGKTVTSSGMTLSGAQAGNYSLTSVNTTIANITPRLLTVINTNRSKVYGVTLTNADYTGSITGIQAGDNITVTRASTGDAVNATVAGSTYPIVGTLVDPNGRLANYTVSNPDGVLTVIKADLTVVNTSRSKVYGVALTNADYAGSISGVVVGDSITVTRASTLCVANATVVAPGPTYPIIGTLADPNGRLVNYNVTNPNGVLTITPAPVNSSVSVSPTTVQYSDEATFTARIVGGAPLVSGGSQAAVSATFKVGTQTMGTANFSVIGSDLVATCTYALVEEVMGQMAPGSRTVTAVINGADSNFGISNLAPTNTLTINKEDAWVDYTGDIMKATASSSTRSATVELRANIFDISVFGDPAYDAFPGDIRNAKVKFVNRETGADISGWIPVTTLLNPTDTKVGTVSYNHLVNLPSNADYIFLNVGVIVDNGYYIRNNQDDNTVVTVYLPVGDFITGGGYIVPTQSIGTMASTPGKKVNFGFNVKFNKTGKNLNGNMNIIFRRLESDGIVHSYQIKANAMLSLGVNATNQASQTAEYVSKTNLTDITNPLSTISMGGNKYLYVKMTDNGEPGLNDMISFVLVEGNADPTVPANIIFSSNWVSFKTQQMKLAGGNLKVHSGFNLGTPTARISSEEVTAKQVIELPTEPVPFNVIVYPNPTKYQFTLEVQGESKEKVSVQVFDMLGKLIKVIEKNDGQPIVFGEELPLSVYIAIVTQGDNRKTIKLIKQ